MACARICSILIYPGSVLNCRSFRPQVLASVSQISISELSQITAQLQKWLVDLLATDLLPCSYCNCSKSSFRTPNKFSISPPTSRISLESCPVTRAKLRCGISRCVGRHVQENSLTVRIEYRKIFVDST